MSVKSVIGLGAYQGFAQPIVKKNVQDLPGNNPNTVPKPKDDVKIVIRKDLGSPADDVPAPDLDKGFAQPVVLPDKGVAQPPVFPDKGNVQVTGTLGPLGSADSSGLLFDTLFREFEFSVSTVYNRWTADEETNSEEKIGDRPLSEIPRYNVLTWRQAPILAPVQKLVGKGSRNDLAFTADSPAGAYIVRGIPFAPSHIKEFDRVVKSTSDHAVAPGVLRLLVQRASFDISTGRTLDMGDIEEAFLEDPQNYGISLHELRSNFLSFVDRNETAARISEMTTLVDESTDTPFTIKREGDATAEIRVSSEISPGLGFRASVIDDSGFGTVEDIWSTVAPDQTPVPVEPLIQLNVSNVVPDKLITRESVSSARSPDHLESIIQMAHLAPGMELFFSMGAFAKRKKHELVSFVSPPTTPFMEYVGYQIEKFEQTDDGSFVFRESINLPSRDYDSYVDPRVKYGSVYRYRIRALFRWTRDRRYDPDGNTNVDPHVVDNVTNVQSSYFWTNFSDWTHAFFVDLGKPNWPDELSVRPMSSQNRICVSFKVPEDPRDDIYLMWLYRKIIDQNGNELTDWEKIGSDWGAENVLFFDGDVRPGFTYVYATRSVCRHGTVSDFSEQIACRLNGEYKTQGEFPVTQLSCAGVSDRSQGAFSRNPPVRFPFEVVCPPGSGIKISSRDGNSWMWYSGSSYVLRAESLDTGQVVDIPISVEYQTIDPRKIVNDGSLPPPPKKKILPEPVFRDWEVVKGNTDPSWK